MQGDVGSGKTIVSLLSMANAIEANFQCAFMALQKYYQINIFNFLEKFLQIN